MSISPNVLLRCETHKILGELQRTAYTMLGEVALFILSIHYTKPYFFWCDYCRCWIFRFTFIIFTFTISYDKIAFEVFVIHYKLYHSIYTHCIFWLEGIFWAKSLIVSKCDLNPPFCSSITSIPPNF